MSQPNAIGLPEIVIASPAVQLHPLICAWFDEQRAAGEPLELLESGEPSSRLVVLSALLTGLASRGHVLQRPAGRLFPIHCQITGIPIEIEMCERQAWREKPRKGRRRKDPLSGEGEWIPTGQIDVLAEDDRKKRRWRIDLRPLKRQIDRVIRNLERLAADAIESRRSDAEFEDAYERAKLRWERRVHRRTHEKESWSNLREAAANREEARLLRRLIAEVRRQAEAMPEPPENYVTWLAWARGHVARLDPLTNGVGPFLEPYGDVGVVPPEEPLTENDRKFDQYIVEDVREGILP